MAEHADDGIAALQEAARAIIAARAALDAALQATLSALPAGSESTDDDVAGFALPSLGGLNPLGGLTQPVLGSNFRRLGGRPGWVEDSNSGCTNNGCGGGSGGGGGGGTGCPQNL